MMIFLPYSSIAQNRGNVAVNGNVLVNDNNNTNMSGNQLLNVSNINYTSNLQVPVQAQSFNVPVINNTYGGSYGGGPNTRGYSAPVMRQQSTNKPKPVKPLANRTQAVMPKPNTNLAYAPKPKPGASNPVISRGTTPSPVTTQTVTNTVNAPVAEQINTINNPVIAANLIENVPVQSNEQVQTASTVSAPVKTTFRTGSSRISKGSAGSGASKSAAHKKSKHKKHGSFFYVTNKKFTKFFAKNRKGNFDPAKCFVWK